MLFDLSILGCNSALPALGRHPTSQILKIHNQTVLIDCGEGTQMRMNTFHIKRGKIRYIFISHLHGDHIFGLPGLLTSYSLNGRTEPLYIFSPKGLEALIRITLKNSGSILSYPIHFEEVDTTKAAKIFENNAFSVTAFPLIHRVPTTGYLFRERFHLRNIIAEKIQKHQIPYDQIDSIKEGADFVLADGRIIPNEELTTPPPQERTYAYCSDTMYSEAILPHIQNVDLLYHEATFLQEHLDRAIYSKHTTAHQAATIAKKAGAKKLVLGHYSSRYADLDPLLKEARAVFANTLLGIEGATYRVDRY